MNWQSWYVLLGPAFLFPILAYRAERNYRAMTQLQLSDSSSKTMLYPTLSIIVPARNEEANLASLLSSLKKIEYPGHFEIIVVDDNSSDNTRSVSEEMGVQVIRAGDLPTGWLGKPHACHQGALHSQGEWLLFTDADTRHDPRGPISALSYVFENRLDGLSLFLQQMPFGLIDRLVLMTAFAGLYAGMQPEHPILNGQYILIRRDAYFHCGGFAAVRSEPLEDLALAHVLKQFGFRVPMLRGESAGSVRMYLNVRHLWNGMTRIGSGSLKWGGTGGFFTALYITGALVPILALPAMKLSEMPAGWVFALWVTSILLLVPWGVRFGSWTLGFLAPFGALFVQIGAIWGLAAQWIGYGVSWKGRKV